MNNAVIGLIRTFVPTVIGALITFLATYNIAVGDDTKDALIAGLVGVITAVYYAIITYLERNVSPKWGWLLGLARAPFYDNTPDNTNTDPPRTNPPEDGSVQPDDPPQVFE